MLEVIGVLMFFCCSWYYCSVSRLVIMSSVGRMLKFRMMLVMVVFG